MTIITIMSSLYRNAHNLNLHFLQRSFLDSLKISDLSKYENYMIKKSYGEARQFEQLCRYFERLIARAPEYSSVARIPLKTFNIINAQKLLKETRFCKNSTFIQNLLAVIWY